MRHIIPLIIKKQLISVSVYLPCENELTQTWRLTKYLGPSEELSTDNIMKIDMSKIARQIFQFSMVRKKQKDSHYEQE